MAVPGSKARKGRSSASGVAERNWSSSSFCSAAVVSASVEAMMVATVGKCRIVQVRAGGHDVAEERDDLRTGYLQCLAVERRTVVSSHRRGRKARALPSVVFFTV